MAGIRQHIIPRFLMKGFASRVDGEESFTWTYRKDSTVFEGNTKNINVEKYFYGKEGEETYADGIITDLEDKFAPLVSKLRDEEGSVDFYKNEITDFISHMIIRTKNFRNSFYNLSEIIRKAHIKHLKEKPFSESKVEDYSALNWFVIVVKSSLILSDAGCIFEAVGKRRFKGFDDNKENLINVFLPLSSQKLLVGSKYRILPSFDIKLLNKVSACYSYDQFISSENSPDRLKLSSLIGSWATLLTDKEIEFYINRMFDEIESTDSLIKLDNQ